MARDKDFCWKCDSYRIYRNDRHPIGLCKDCREDIEVGLGVVGLIVVFVATVIVLPADMIENNSLVLRLVFGVLADFIFFLGLMILYMLYHLFKWLWKGAVEWAQAIWNLVTDIAEERKEKELEAAKQRALEADARRLDGAALDALLTEEYKQKQGWN